MGGRGATLRASTRDISGLKIWTTVVALLVKPMVPTAAGWANCTTNWKAARVARRRFIETNGKKGEVSNETKQL